MKKSLLTLGLALSMFSFEPAQADDMNYDDDSFVSMAESVVTVPASDITDLQRYPDDRWDRGRHGRDTLLGQGYLPLHRGQMVIWTRSCQGGGYGFNSGRVSAIRIQLLNSSGHINSLSIQFGNGEWKTVNFGHVHFLPGQSTQWFNFRSNQDRCVRQVVVDGDADDAFFFYPPVVQVWGRM